MRSTTYGRREFIASAGAAGLAIALAGCGKASVGGGGSSDSGTITWATYDYYSKPAELKPFTEKTGINIITQPVVDPAAIRAKLTLGGTQIDAYQDGSYGGRLAYEAGLLQPIDLSNVPNYEKYLMSEFRDSPGIKFDGKIYGIPSAWGTDSMAYAHERVGGELNDLGALWDPEFAGRIGMPSGLNESIIVAAIYAEVPDPFDMKSDELAKVKELLLKQKPMVRTYWSDIGELANFMATGEVDVAWAWLPIIELGEQAGVDIRWSSIKQGQLSWYEGHYLTKESSGKQKEETEELLNYTLGAEYGATLVEETGYRTTSTAAVAAVPKKKQEELDLTDPGKLLNGSHLWLPPSDPKAYSTVWAEVQNA